MAHTHWEFESECPHCGKINLGKCPIGEKFVVIHCEHCTHSYDYVHIVQDHKDVAD